MKDKPITRKDKEELSAHFSRGGTVHNVAGELARVPMKSREVCHEFWKKKNPRRAENRRDPLAKNSPMPGYTMAMDRAYQGLD